MRRFNNILKSNAFPFGYKQKNKVSIWEYIAIKQYCKIFQFTWKHLLTESTYECLGWLEPISICCRELWGKKPIETFDICVISKVGFIIVSNSSVNQIFFLFICTYIVISFNITARLFGGLGLSFRLLNELKQQNHFFNKRLLGILLVCHLVYIIKLYHLRLV